MLTQSAHTYIATAIVAIGLYTKLVHVYIYPYPRRNILLTPRFISPVGLEVPQKPRQCDLLFSGSVCKTDTSRTISNVQFQNDFFFFGYNYYFAIFNVSIILGTENPWTGKGKRNKSTRARCSVTCVGGRTNLYYIYAEHHIDTFATNTPKPWKTNPIFMSIYTVSSVYLTSTPIPSSAFKSPTTQFPPPGRRLISI